MKLIKGVLKKFVFLRGMARSVDGFAYIMSQSSSVRNWIFSSRESSTFTFNLTLRNRKYLIHYVSLITKQSYEVIEKYFSEVENNKVLKDYVIKRIRGSKYRHKKDLRCDFGSRVAWYAIIRANKCQVVVENGVEIGYTGILLCDALLKNKQEGFAGMYYGLDINPDAGYLISESPYSGISKILVADALASLSNFSMPIDFYFSDGLRTQEYEKREFDLLFEKVNNTGVIVSNKLDLSDALADCATQNNWDFIYFKEQPFKHWFPGSGLGIMFNRV